MTPPPDSDTGTRERRISPLAYVVAGISFIPLIGIPFGIVAIVWGLARMDAGGRKPAVLGASGIGLTVLIYSALFYFGFVHRGGVYDELRLQMAQQNLNALVKEIEFYRYQHGEYPSDLQVLSAEVTNPLASIQDPTTVVFGAEPRLFEYELVQGGERYRLFSLGPDGVSNTADDLQPDLSALGLEDTGLLIELASGSEGRETADASADSR